MKYSIIWICDDNRKHAEQTLASLKRELTGDTKAQILCFGAKEPEGLSGLAGAEITFLPCEEGSRFADLLAQALPLADGEYITQIYSGDTFSGGSLAAVTKAVKEYSRPALLMLHRLTPEGAPDSFSDLPLENTGWVRLQDEMRCYPFYFGGTFVKKSALAGAALQPEFGMEAERCLMLTLCMNAGRLVYLPKQSYHNITEREGELTFFHGIYERAFYLDSFRDFWIPWLTELTETRGSIPLFIQYHAVFSIVKRMLANWGNKNKHVVEGEEARESLALMGDTLRLLDDRVIMNAKKISECNIGDSVKWVMGILKYGKDYRFQRGYLAGKTYYRSDDVLFNTVRSLKTNILFMDARDGYMEIDGTVHPLLYSMADSVYFEYAGKRYDPVYNERYALSKVLGVSIYKAHSFHVSIPYRQYAGSMLYCFALFGGERVKIEYSYESHFSRMSSRFENSYWMFTDAGQYYMMTRENDGLRISRSGRKNRFRQEMKLWKEMLFARADRKRAWLFIAIRAAYFCTKPFIKNRPVWMYLDKIYKAGDSSEYLYRYASKQDNNFRHYYLVNKKCPDYARLRRDGFRPLVYGSIKHRLIFLMADMMVISNSTVFAFNNFGMINSSYVRDLTDFHVCCVQHGMSVQKIAVAQNRLRDNTRLYFCASKYELRNLYHPAYDYFGYDALKLTGVPRYDGLVNNDQKQILISPTWRMQAAVPVRTSEGEQREYNPLFKESMYFKVYNALINDPRLIEAAKRYGYRIKYVLHPIVSAQVKDFDRNDYVDIIPAAGDMSYEKMFCESSLMVTDFSGIQFDFAYMRKPLLYLHHRDIPQHYEEGSFFYDTMAFGEICHDNDELIDMLEQYMADGCRMKEEYVRRADDFFYYNDHNNCKRIYDVMIDYQNRFIRRTEGERGELLQGEFSLQEREKTAAELKAWMDAQEITPGSTTITDDYYDLRLRPNTVLLLGLGKNVRGNLQYILNVLNHSSYFSAFEVYVRADSGTEPLIQSFIEKNGWTRTKPVVDDRQYARLMESAKYLITEVFFPKGWVKKPGQVVINLWHGTPLKKLGLAKNSKNLHKDGNTQRNFIESDYLVYPNRYTRDNMLASYKVAGLLTGRIAMLGYARTGGMMAAAESDQTELLAKLAPNGEQLFAYMPTWKDYLTEETVVAETKELLDYLDTALTDGQILYSNLHHKVNDSLDYGAYRHIRRFPSDVDSYQLLAATDALITDYSSVFYDYLATGKQIVLYCPDYELYRKKRGTYMDLMELPFDKARTKEEVIRALNRGKTYDDTEARRTFCEFDSTENAKKLCSLLYGEFMTDGLTIEEAPAKTGTRVLLYSEAFEDSVMTDRLREAMYMEGSADTKVWLSGEMETIDSFKKSAYPMLSDFPVIGILGDMHLSGRGKTARQLYKDGKLPFDKAIAYLQYDYALAAYRMYGRAPFDRVFIYEVKDPEQLIVLSTIQAERTLFLTSELMNRVLAEEKEMTDAFRFAAARCSRLVAMNDLCREAAARILPGREVEVLRDAAHLRTLLDGTSEGK